MLYILIGFIGGFIVAAVLGFILFAIFLRREAKQDAYKRVCAIKYYKNHPTDFDVGA